jgi:hypothetical protein
MLGGHRTAVQINTMAKKQHYVPRLLLRNFSTDTDHNFINIYHVKKVCSIHNGALYEQASVKYLYGIDQKLEETFAKVESRFSLTLKKLIECDLNFTADERANIIVFVILQMLRTPSIVKEKTNAMNLFIKVLASYNPALKDELDNINIKLKNPYQMLFNIAIELFHTIIDLSIGILNNNTDIPFLIGEQPVVILNPFLQMKNWPESKLGIGNKGAMLILPLSPSKTLCLFDRQRYRFTNLKKVIDLNEQDVKLLNKCQFMKTENCIYYNKNISLEYLRKNALDTAEFRSYSNSKLRVLPTINNKEIKIIMFGDRELPIYQDFHFLGYIAREFYKDLGKSLDIRREHVKAYEKVIK